MSARNEELFGRIAVSDGYITREQLEECLSVKSQSDSNSTLWQIMVEKSYIDHHTTNKILEKVDRELKAEKSNRGVDKFFGDVAVSNGFCTAEQMEQAIAEQKRRMQEGRNQRLGELCVEMGILTPQQIAQMKMGVCVFRGRRDGVLEHVDRFSS